MSSAKRLLLAGCVIGSFAVVGCNNDKDKDHSMQSGRDRNSTYDNASGAGTHYNGGNSSSGLNGATANDNTPNAAQPSRTHDDATGPNGVPSNRIDGRLDGAAGAGTATPTNNARPGINSGEGSAVPGTNAGGSSAATDAGGPGVGTGSTDTAAEPSNRIRPGNASTPVDAGGTRAKPGAPADTTDNAAKPDDSSNNNTGNADEKK